MLRLFAFVSTYLLMNYGIAAPRNMSLQDDPNVAIVRAHCTACHSAALITQNRLTREGWTETIRWMQKKQGLWPLGQHEEVILNYLVTHYSPNEHGRRKALSPDLMPHQNKAKDQEH